MQTRRKPKSPEEKYATRVAFFLWEWIITGTWPGRTSADVEGADVIVNVELLEFILDVVLSNARTG
jgi:hypothetical protein